MFRSLTSKTYFVVIFGWTISKPQGEFSKSAFRFFIEVVQLHENAENEDPSAISLLDQKNNQGIGNDSKKS